MPFVHTLDGTVPSNAALVSFGAGNIRDLTAALIERLNSFFVDANTSPLTGKTGASMAATTFTAGLTISAGTASCQAITATTITASNTIQAGVSSAFAWVGRSAMQSPADGTIALLNNAGTNFTLLQFGGTSATFPAIKRVAAAFNFRLADDSAFCDIGAGSITAVSGLTVVAGTAACQAITGTTAVLSSTTTALAFIDGNTIAPAAAGSVRLGNTSTISARNATNSADVQLIQLTAGNIVDVGNSNLVSMLGRVGIGAVSPATSAALEVLSTTGAILIPRLTTTQKNALTPTDGMILYDSTLAKFQGREAGAWLNFSGL